MNNHNNCADYTAPKALLKECYNPKAVEALVVGLLEAVRGPNAAHDGGACNRLLIQALTGKSPEQS